MSTLKNITKPGFQRLQQLLLDHVSQRKGIECEIAEARSHGDLKENAAFDLAKDKKNMNEARIKELEALLQERNIVDLYHKQPSNVVEFGCRVTLVELENQETYIYYIVGEGEANLQLKQISIQSPMSQLMLGKKVGDSFIQGKRQLKILEII